MGDEPHNCSRGKPLAWQPMQKTTCHSGPRDKQWALILFSGPSQELLSRAGGRTGASGQGCPSDVCGPRQIFWGDALYIKKLESFKVSMLVPFWWPITCSYQRNAAAASGHCLLELWPGTTP